MIIRRAKARDAKNIIAIASASLHSRYSQSYFARYIGSTYVADKNGAVVGFLIHKDQTILNIAISRAARRTGIGKALLKHRMADSKMLILHVRESNKAAINLYKQLGFEQIARIPHYYLDGEPALKFVWKK